MCAWLRIAVATVMVLGVASCSSSTQSSPTAASDSSAAPTTPTTPPAVTPTTRAAPSTSVTESDGGVTQMTARVVESVPHDAGAFTQGLVFDDTGVLYESTGLQGQSSVREVDPETGLVVRARSVDAAYFGEGLALVDDRLIQLTWQDGVAFVYDTATFEQIGSFEYDGEGWGLCYDGERLVMSDGTDVLEFRDPDTFAVEGSVRVTMDGDVLELLNELECVDDRVYANLWRSDLVAVIDPSTGVVETLIDASTLERPANADVLNGIAVDPDGGLWLTGKLWDAMYRVELVPET
jgi:glutaminyl-peptide cyclotransferase